MRKKIVAGNWKMNNNFHEAEDLLIEIDEMMTDNPVPGVAVVLCVPFPYLEMATDMAKESNFLVGAQNLYPGESGAFTGEISAPMLASLETDVCIIGHSERRKYFHEDNALLAEKVKSALKYEIIPIFCCGETLAEREKGIHKEVVENQLKESLFHLNPDGFSNVVIAYEPVWAIGTGVNATPEQAQEMHSFIRYIVAKKYGEPLAGETSILYGGSCNSANAGVLFAQPDVDGGLIGGASLKAEEFWKIVQSFDNP
ncbi:MAG: triose-phosphate isomerase [Bacteroidetes bacterium]|nr:triose-phosphate isomerase [Bacteroidota bacterium]